MNTHLDGNGREMNIGDHVVFSGTVGIVYDIGDDSVVLKSKEISTESIVPTEYARFHGTWHSANVLVHHQLRVVSLGVPA